MEVHNKDVHPDEDTLKLYPAVRFLTNNELLQKEFDKFERDAVHYKKIYHWCGQTAVWLTTASAIYSVVFVAIGKAFPAYLSWAAIASAVLALALQAYLFTGRPKSRWLKARFGAERVRSLKFQAFALVSGSEGDLQDRIAVFSRENLVRLKSELNRGEVALTEFIPSRALPRDKMESWAGSADTLRQARAAYRDLRLAYQKGFADAAEHSIVQAASVGRALSDALFVTGAVLVAFVLCDKAFHLVSSNEVETWLEMVSVIVFILSAAFAITEKASIAEVSKARYYEYATALDHLQIAFDASGDKSLDLEVLEVEQLALRELQQFSISALLTSFRL